MPCLCYIFDIYDIVYRYMIAVLVYWYLFWFCFHCHWLQYEC